MVSGKVNIKNPAGLHMRPAGRLCEEAMKFSCNIHIEKPGGTYNAKSMLSVLGACVKAGDQIGLLCDGEDEAEALEYLTDFMENHLGDI